MNNFLKIILIPIVLLTAYTYAFAGIGVEPALIEISACPGKVNGGQLLVCNYNNKNLKIKSEAEYFFKPPKLNNKDLDLNSWLTIEPVEFMLGAGEKKKVNYFINLPRGFKGETLAQIYFSTVDDSKEKIKGAAVKTRFGVGLYVVAKNTENLGARINKINILQKDKEIKYALEVENLGNIHLRPKGEIIIEDLKGNEIQRLETQYGWPVFPHGKYSYDTKWQNLNLAPGKYKAKATIIYYNPYDKKINKILKSQVTFSVLGNNQVILKKEKGEENVL